MTTRLTFLLALAFVLISLSSCQNKEALEEQKRLEKQQKKLAEIQKAIIPSAAFVAFVNGFDSGLQSGKFDAKWLEDFSTNSNIKEISPKVCESFIYGNSVWSHHIGTDRNDIEHKTLKDDKPYYYVGQIANSEKYTALVFTDLEEGATETYLCTYTKDGQFISGIVLQANYIDEEVENVRNATLSGTHQVSLRFEEKIGEKSNMIDFTLMPNGEILPSQKNS